MPMPVEWIKKPPRTLVVGEGVYARALAGILAPGGLVTAKMLLQGLRVPHDMPGMRGKPRVWRDVGLIVLLWESELSTADVIWRHAQLWRTIQEWTEHLEFHELKWIIGLIDLPDNDTRERLRQQLLVSALDGNDGYGLWDRSSGLPRLLDLAEATCGVVYQEWEARKREDTGRLMLGDVRDALRAGDAGPIKSAANAAWDHFKLRLVDVDSYCQPPCHPNGHRWRDWLRDAVTNPVTPDTQQRGNEMLALLNL
jgi:hypothetical protein